MEAKAEEDIVTLVCSEQDFQFIAEDFEAIALGICEQFGLDPHIEMFLETNDDCEAGQILMFLNGEPHTIIPIIDEYDGEITPVKKKKDNRILH